MHGASFRYNQCPRHSGAGYNPKLELRNGVVHLASKGPIIGHYGLEANAMTVAEELGLEYEDIASILITMKSTGLLAAAATDRPLLPGP